MIEDGGSGINDNNIYQDSTKCIFLPPSQFNFKQPQSWDKWIKRFERYSTLSGLDKSTSENQVTTLIYCMGEEAEDILSASNLTEDDKKDINKIKTMYNDV